MPVVKTCTTVPVEVSAGDKVLCNKKADVGERFGMFPHVGLLFDEPPGSTGLFFT